MKVITRLAVTAMLAGALLSGCLISGNAEYVLGGEYNLEAGQSLKGNLYALFAECACRWAPGCRDVFTPRAAT